MKWIIVLGLIAFIAVVQAQDNFECVEGVRYQENECNLCVCAENKTNGLACTDMLCESHQNEKLTKCVVGTQWTNNCNNCYCVEDVGTLCETKEC